MSFRNVWSAPLCEMSIHDAIAHFAVSTQGHIVPLWEDYHEEQEQWCRETLSKRWVSARKLITADQLNDELEARFSQGHLGPSVRPLDVSVQTVRASSRKLSAKWNMHVPSSPMVMPHEYGLDVEQELMDCLTAEITAEMDQEFLAAMSCTTGTSPTLRKQLRKLQAVWHFAFADAKEATLFKLTWGGE